MTLPDLCTRRPVLATVMSILIVVLGIAALTRMPVRELPNTSTAQVTVSVGYTGAGPGVVDSELASVIEGAISTVAGIDRVSTESELGGLRTAEGKAPWVRLHYVYPYPHVDQVIPLMAEGLLNKQIAWKLGLSERTIKMHRSALLRSLGLETTADAIRLAVEAGY